MSADSPLSPAGVDRARTLARMLKDTGIVRIFVTEVLRTQQTAAPLAAALHLTPVVIAQANTDTLLTELRKLGDNDTVLVVGHTATIPQIVEKMGGGPRSHLGR